ncbi:hypothetical protein V8F20_012220 [Naviculisporaceae sp. PSN 640]
MSTFKYHLESTPAGHAIRTSKTDQSTMSDHASTAKPGDVDASKILGAPALKTAVHDLVSVSASALDNSSTGDLTESLGDKANLDFPGFVATHFLNSEGCPDRQKTPEPVRFDIGNPEQLPAMWAIVKDIPGLVLLRKHTYSTVIGWESQLRQETLNTFASRRRYHVPSSPWNVHTAFINAEPKLFLRRSLGIDLNLGRPLFLAETRNSRPFTVNRFKLIYPSILNELQKQHLGLFIMNYNGIAAIGWDQELVYAEIQSLRARKIRQKADRDAEAHHLVELWTDQAAKYKGNDDELYFLARHQIIRARMNIFPGLPTKLEFAHLLGAYAVKIV